MPKLLSYAEYQNYPLSIGADPEFFLVDSKTKKAVAPHEYIGGTKHAPEPVDGGAIQVDGLAVEFNIDPAATVTSFQRNIKMVLDELRRRIPKHLDFVFSPTMWFDEDYLAKLPAEVLELGCDPDFDAYNNGAPNPRPKPVVKDGKVLRTAAGHIHLGWPGDKDINSEEHRWDCILLAKRMDMIFGEITKEYDKDTLRASMYGKPGAYRPKRYGMEYRTPSNLWVLNSSMQHNIYNMARYSFGSLLTCDNFKKRTDIEIYNHSGYPSENIYSMPYRWKGTTIPLLLNINGLTEMQYRVNKGDLIWR